MVATSASPAITVKEIDLSGYVPSVTSTTGAFVGNFRWGPVREATLVDTEARLAAKFGSPSASNAIDFLSAAQFLKYSGNMYVVREVEGFAVNATSGSYELRIRNKDHFDTLTFGADSGETTVGGWAAKYPGVLGNSLKVHMVSASIADWSGWTYSDEFDSKPGTSDYVANRHTLGTAANDEVHVVVVDEDGEFSGTPGTVLEKWAYLSVASDAKTNDGSKNYAFDVINDGSAYIWLAHWDDDLTAFTHAGKTSSAEATAFNSGATVASALSLDGGLDGATLSGSEYQAGFDLFQDVENITVDFLIAPNIADATAHKTVVEYMVTMAASTRKDCVAVASPARSDVVNVTDPASDTISGLSSYTKSSYLVLDCNYLKVYDKYNDQYVFIPAASSTAGIMAATDLNAAPWFSPAGQRRGQYFGVTSLAYSPNKAERDLLYKAGINPVANIPGQGILLFGDKTNLARPSAFDRINVRRLFLVVERAIAEAAKNVMFEFNDEFTRAEFVNIVEPFLREIQGRRGITDFRVVCDETNNTPDVIDRNEFIANIFIKPARSINFVTLNFVAVRTGVDFEEIVGAV